MLGVSDLQIMEVDGAMVNGNTGPILAVPPPPPQSFSRYRTLRGKSISSACGLDIFRDKSPSAAAPNGTAGNFADYSQSSQSQQSDDNCAPSSGSPRARSKSVTSLRNALRSNDSQIPAVPPLPKKILAPKPINISAQSSLKVLESLKSPIFPSDRPLWKRSASYSNLASKAGFISRHKDKKEKDSQTAPSSPAAPPVPPIPPVPAVAADSPFGIAITTPTPTEEVPQPTPQVQDLAHGEEPCRRTDESSNEDRTNQVLTTPRESNDSSCGNISNSSSGLADEVARLEAETDRILAEQKKRDLARLKKELVTPPPKAKRQILDKLTFFSRGKRSAPASSQPATPSTIVSAIFSPAFSHTSRESSIEEDALSPSLVPTADMSFIEPGGKGIVPQIDAPVSAINGGERRVIVRCFSSTINLPVTADTSSIDILNSTASMTRHHISPTTSIIVECYFVLGLERRVRRYESIRDIMNSWDRDQQNSLLVMPCDGPKSDQDLDLSTVPRTEEPPSGFSLQMHHSSRPGKWNKRWVTLLDNGQIYAAKSANVQPSDKESVVLCHLTDFDIYAPKESELRRSLKPPKQFCYAIKSQQKTVVFPDGENFVHFFSLDDPQQAARFYEKVHGWRSWYLVNRMVDLERRNKVPQIELKAAQGNSSPKKSIKSGKSGEHASGAEDEEEVEDDEPLMNVNDFRMSKIVINQNNAIKADASCNSNTTPLNINTNIDTTLNKSLSLRSKPPHRSNTTKAKSSAPMVPQTVQEQEEPEFSSRGLLGDAYDKRKQNEASSNSPTTVSRVDGPFTAAPSLLNGGIPNPSEEKDEEPKSWFPSATEHTAAVRTRSKSIHTPEHPQMQRRRPATAGTSGPSHHHAPASRRERHPAPLLSFAKDFPEPPRFRNGPQQGMRQRTQNGQPLINFAGGGPPPSRMVPRLPSDARRPLPPRGSSVNAGAGPTSPTSRSPSGPLLR